MFHLCPTSCLRSHCVSLSGISHIISHQISEHHIGLTLHSTYLSIMYRTLMTEASGICSGLVAKMTKMTPVCQILIPLKRGKSMNHNFRDPFSSSSQFSSTTAPVESQQDESRKSSLKPLICWKCQSPVTSQAFPIICPGCNTLQKHEPKVTPDYFTLLGQSPDSYQVNLSSLSYNMKRIQRLLHPDLFTNKSIEEQEVSQNLSSLVNQALVTLQNPIQRGIYLLELRGIFIDLEKQLTLDTEFLGEVMELNEKLEEISNSQHWLDFRAANEKEIELLEKKLGKAFQRGNTEEAQLILSKMKYFENLQLKLKEIQSKFNVVD